MILTLTSISPNKVLRYLLLPCLFFAAIITNQAQESLVNRADKLCQSFDYHNAARLYEKTLEKYPSLVDVKEKLAYCYKMTNNSELSEIWFSQLVKEVPGNADYKFELAQALRANEKYAQARFYYQEYGFMAPEDDRIEDILDGLDDLQQLKSTDPSVQIELLDINSAHADFGPSFYRGGLIFTSNRPVNSSSYVDRTDVWSAAPFLELFLAEKDAAGKYRDPQPIKGNQPNRIYHEGPATFPPGGTEMYLTRTNYVNRKAIKGQDEIVRLKLFKLKFDEFLQEWGEMEEAVPFNSNDYSVGHGSISPDGKELYFMSDMPGGFGGPDIYLSTRQGEEWGDPVNLGSGVNTAGAELFPFIAEDGTLYFSSDSRGGLGGLDVYKTKREKNVFKSAENLGAPVNSNKDDFSYVINRDGQGYFSSNRLGGYGDDDIYAVKVRGNQLAGVVYESRTKDHMDDVMVKLYEGIDLVDSMLTVGGKFAFSFSPGRTYKILAESEGYFPEELILPTKDEESVFVKIPLRTIGGYSLEVNVSDIKSEANLEGANVRMIKLSDNSEKNLLTNSDGVAYFVLEENEDYKIEVTKEVDDAKKKYLNVSSSISTIGKPRDSYLFQNIELSLVEIGVAIKIENIYYDVNKADIRPDAARELDKLLKILQDNNTMEIELSSHTDCRSSAKYNLDLSAKRAASAVNYLISKGIDSRRLISVGYGETRLVNHCECENGVNVPCTEDQHQENRRTEFKILSF